MENNEKNFSDKVIDFFMKFLHRFVIVCFFFFIIGCLIAICNKIGVTSFVICSVVCALFVAVFNVFAFTSHRESVAFKLHAMTTVASLVLAWVVLNFFTSL